MTPDDLCTLLERRPLLLDGGLGTILISMGLEQGHAPERWVLEHPERVMEAHERYALAGSDVVHTVTFGATPIKLASAGLSGRCDELNKRAVELARTAAHGRSLVAGDIGPTGRFLPPTGDATEEELLEAFAKQVGTLSAAGVDLLSIETMYDLREARAAVRAAKESGLAVLCSMTFEVKRRGVFTFMGDRLDTSLAALHEEGATGVGFNCSVTSDQMIALVKQATEALPGVPIVAQPNAGQPITTPEGIRYECRPDVFAADMMEMVGLGARVVGGCCGTDETFIKALRAELERPREVG